MEPRFPFTFGLVLTAALAFWPVRAEACSCGAADEGFVWPSGAVLPRNTGGFPWWGEVHQFRNDRVERALPPRTLFKIERVAAGGPENVDFDLQFAPEAFADRTPPPWSRALVILKPRHPLSAGAKYRLSYRLREFPRYSEKPSLSDRYQIVEVSVSADPMPATTRASLALGKVVVAPLQVSGRGGLCSMGISAAQLPVSLRLPPAAEPWRNALLYDVTLDGERAWRPAHSSCEEVPHGTSWVGQSKELLFVSCSDAPVAEPLSPGEHLVTMRAWLPGTDLVLTAVRRVSLACH
jgi:hypothetical protein